MAEPDPLAALALAPDERVLWQGRAALGSATPSWPGLLWRALASLAILGLPFVAMLLAERPGAQVGMMLAALFVGGSLAIASLGKVLGPFPGTYALLLALIPAFALVWTRQVTQVGWVGALGTLGPSRLGVAGLVLALPLARLALGVHARLGVLYVITDERVVAVRRGALLWSAPRAGLRVGRRMGGTCLVLGLRKLHLRDDDPARVIDAVARG